MAAEKRIFEIAAAGAALFLVFGCAAPTTEDGIGGVEPSKGQTQPLLLHVTVPSGRFDCDVYLPREDTPAPLVIVAHGFSRTKANMADWGRRLAREGFVVAVPTMPTWANHARNAGAIREVADWLPARQELKGRLDVTRIGLMGFSAGGLATLLATSEEPRVRVWVGLDPVDRDGQGAAAAQRLKCPAFILRAEPHACNAHGNAEGIQRALVTKTFFLRVIGGTHADPEWPTDRIAEGVCGKSSPQRRIVFVEYAVAALRTELLGDRAAASILAKVEKDIRVTVVKKPLP